MIFARLEDLLKEYKEKVSKRVEALSPPPDASFHDKVRRLIAVDLKNRPSHAIARDLRNLVELLELGIF